MPSLLLVTLLGACLGQAQEFPVRRLMLDPQGGVQRVVLAIPRPLSQHDELVFWSPTQRIQAALLTPDGKRVTADNAISLGIDWAPDAKLVDSPDGDAPMTVAVRFGSSPPPGDYVFEVTPKDLKIPAEVTLSLRTEVRPSAAPTIVRGPVKASPKGQLEWMVDIDEEGATIDILVTDPDAKVSVLVPQNVTVEARNASQMGLRWRTTDNPTTLDAPGGLFTISGFYLPYPGTHHVVNFPRAPRGLYRVMVESQKDCELRTAFIATGRLMQTSYDIIERAGPVRKAEVRMVIQPIPDPVHVGDNVPINLEFDGEPIRRQLQFTATAHYDGNPPVDRPLNVFFGWGMDLIFRSYFQPEREGKVHLTVTASGRTVEGSPFTVEAKSAPLVVKPLTAQFLGIWEQSHDANGNTLLDRMEIHNELQVVRAGNYKAKLRLAAPNKMFIDAEGSATLSPGRQRLTVAIPASKVRQLGSDGPFRVYDLELIVEENGKLLDRVSAPGIQIMTIPYRLAQWER